DKLEQYGADGSTFWMLSNTWDGNDGYFILCPSDPTCDIIHDHATYMKGLIPDCAVAGDCDDGIYCNGAETCNTGTGICEVGTPVDCSANDIPTIAACDWSPDDDPVTFDYFAGFASQCEEATQSCTSGNLVISHVCDVDTCGAECEYDSDCDDSDALTIDTCLGNCTCRHESVSDCIVPYNDMNITNSTPLCPGTYYLPDGINVRYAHSVLDCDGAKLYGDSGVGTGVRIYGGNVTINNCRISSYNFAVDPATNIHLHNNIISDVASGVYKLQGYSSVIQGNHFENITGSAVELWHSKDGVYKDNTFLGVNTAFHMHDEDNSVFEDNIIEDVSIGFFLWWGTDNNVFRNNTIEQFSTAFYFDWHASYNEFIDNAIINYDGNGAGFMHNYQYKGTIYNNSFIGNNITGAYQGFAVNADENSVYLNNTVEECEIAVSISYSENSEVYHNNFINSARFHIGDVDHSTNLVDSNYYDNYDEPAEGCHDEDSDSICDAPFNFYGSRHDLNPYTQQDGWSAPRPLDLSIADISTSPYPITAKTDFNYTIYVNYYGSDVIDTDIDVYLNGHFMENLPAYDLSPNRINVLKGQSSLPWIANYSMLLVVDPTDSHAEADEANNNYSEMLSVGCNPLDCDDDGYIAVSQGGDDCDDSNPGINPGIQEDCMTPFDDNCNGITNEEDALNCYNFYRDEDKDSYGTDDPQDYRCLCYLDGSTEGYYTAPWHTDCDDLNASINRKSLEWCYNSVDDNCNGIQEDDEDFCVWMNGSNLVKEIRYDPDECGTASSYFCQECREHGGRIKPGEQKCWCDMEVRYFFPFGDMCEG
ncbi:hypothetical protein GF351_01265, partial [Candidatus Woesearchaeota archaeon]|nr:hypothetical protein [Candidatus Woesearchaeota archaeon]